ncbi:MAG: glutathione ABC transporter substrate-binding protein [Tepidibacillus sp.]|uniref:glutathione ABC transporter substrate-binding protein n=1 Tax=Tepidibacillus sp. HK-1 TaxID=1883407 RepID=UPI000852E816|nr:glutathione ABC transporter substrate-binding protein [Tepidibacillus sp. HK-1]GBF10061.1 glutathione-binding protein GsiB precursor [Tepidibacillus sp. HK-1]
MNLKKTLVLSVILILTLSIALIGCSSKTSAPKEESQNVKESTAKEGNDITIAVADNFISLDPHDTNDTLSFSAEKTMLEGLIGFDKDMKMVPVLADKWVASEDAKEFTFFLKKGISFHDGTSFNAEAVKTNIDRLADPNSKLKRHSLFALVDKTEVVDEYTVKVTLKEPFGAMLNNFAHPAAMMISPKALKEGVDVARNPVGTGPYKFKEWKPGDHLTVVKNDQYWKEGQPKLDSITFKPVPENGSRIAMLKTGEADFIYPVPAEEVNSINGKDGIVVENKPSIIVRYMSMNTQKKPFDNVKVRQALNYAVNKEAYLKVVNNGYGTIMNSIIAPNVQFFAEQQPYEFNVEKAKQLLAEAGYPNGFEATLWSNNNSISIKATQFLQQQLAQIGVKVNIENMETGTMADKIWTVQDPKDATIQLYYGGWSPSTGDADWGIRPLLGGDLIPPKGYNTAYYQNPKADEAIQAALKTADAEQRKAAYAKVQKLIWEDAPWVYLGVDETIFGKRDYLQGAYLLPDGALSVENAEIVRK